jgi:hypothetical protein
MTQALLTPCTLAGWRAVETHGSCFGETLGSCFADAVQVQIQQAELCCVYRRGHAVGRPLRVRAIRVTVRSGLPTHLYTRMHIKSPARAVLPRRRPRRNTGQLMGMAPTHGEKAVDAWSTTAAGRDGETRKGRSVTCDHAHLLEAGWILYAWRGLLASCCCGLLWAVVVCRDALGGCLPCLACRGPLPAGAPAGRHQPWQCRCLGRDPRSTAHYASGRGRPAHVTPCARTDDPATRSSHSPRPAATMQKETSRRTTAQP